jgi:uncharacterized protein (DUF433 family)
MGSQVSTNPAVCHGKPVIAGTRVLVANILAELAAGATHADIIAEYPSLTSADICAALEFGSRLASFEEIPATALLA